MGTQSTHTHELGFYHINKSHYNYKNVVNVFSPSVEELVSIILFSLSGQSAPFPQKSPKCSSRLAFR